MPGPPTLKTVVLLLTLASATCAQSPTFSTGGEDVVYWEQPWVAQSLSYPAGAYVQGLEAAFKDGLEGNRLRVEFFRAYDGAGGFGEPIQAEAIVVGPNVEATYGFTPPVRLEGSPDGVYYMRLSPATGGVLHGSARWGDEGTDPLRHGGTGRLIIPAEPKGVDEPRFRYDLANLRLITSPIPREAVSVLSFGARGDGATDDTAAFARALASGAGRVQVPAGRYALGPEAVTVPAGVVLSGDGPSTVLCAAAGTGELLNLGSRSQVRDVSIDGARAPQGGVSDGLIALRHADGCLVERVSITDCDRACIFADHANDLTIRGCEFRRIGLAISLTFSSRVKITDNTVADARIHGIQFWGNWQFERQECEDLLISGNRVRNGGGGPIWGTGGRRVVIVGNIVDGAEDVGIDLEWCADSTICGNTVRNCRNAGISLFFACTAVSITGNTVANDREIDDPEAQWYVRAGIWLTPPNREEFPGDRGHRDVVVVGNTLVSAEGPRRGMWIGSEVRNVRIEANAIAGPGIFYGGHHRVSPLSLRPLEQPVLIDNMPTEDKPRL